MDQMNFHQLRSKMDAINEAADEAEEGVIGSIARGLDEQFVAAFKDA